MGLTSVNTSQIEFYVVLTVSEVEGVGVDTRMIEQRLSQEF